MVRRQTSGLHADPRGTRAALPRLPQFQPMLYPSGEYSSSRSALARFRRSKVHRHSSGVDRSGHSVSFRRWARSPPEPPEAFAKTGTCRWQARQRCSGMSSSWQNGQSRRTRVRSPWSSNASSRCAGGLFDVIHVMQVGKSVGVPCSPIRLMTVGRDMSPGPCLPP